MILSPKSPVLGERLAADAEPHCWLPSPGDSALAAIAAAPEVSPAVASAAGSNAEAVTQVFLFVNPKSGGGQASAYLKALGKAGSPWAVDLGSGFGRVELRAYDILDGESGEKPGFLLAKEFSEEASFEAPVRIMVAGGDGTVMWAMSELAKVNVDLGRMAVGHVPFGTGNDFSRSTGWGAAAPADLVGTDRKFLRRDLRRWLTAEVIDFDLWEVEVTTAAEGGFSFVHEGRKSLEEADEKKHGLVKLPDGGWQMRKPMANYFSLGQSCRVGLGFEKRRTRSRIGNNLRYILEGAKKCWFRPAPLVSDVVGELTIVGESSSSSGAASTSMLSTLTGICSDGSRRISFTRQQCGGSCCISARASVPGEEAPLPPTDAQAAAELLFINIPSFAGGADPWAWAAKASSSRMGSGSASGASLEACQQEVGDGRLEVVTYSSPMGVAKDAAKGKLSVPWAGAGRRLASAQGPFVASFLPADEAKYTSREGRVYFQVDGEFFLAKRPREAVVRHWRTVRVLQGS